MKKLFLFLIIFMPVILKANLMESMNFKSTEYGASFTRSASTDSADSVIYNPAGTIMMGKGLFIKADSQAVLEKRSVEYNEENSYKNYDNSNSLFVVFNLEKISFFGSYSGVNLFSNGNFKDGVPYFSIIQGDVFTAEASSNANLDSTTDTIELEDSNLKVSSKGYELRSGISYKILDSLSVSLGGKYLFNKLEYSGSGFYRYFSPSGIPGIDNNIHSERYSIDYKADLKAYGYFFGLYGKVLDYASIGFSYNGYGDLKYSGESLTSDLPVNLIDSKVDKLPSIYSLGIQSERFYSMHLSLNGTYSYIDSSNNSKDYAVSLGYLFENGSTFDMGYKKSIVKSESSSYLKHESDSDSFGAGFKTLISKNSKLSVSASIVKYKDISLNQYGSATEEFKRDYKIISFSVDFAWDVLASDPVAVP